MSTFDKMRCIKKIHRYNEYLACPIVFNVKIIFKILKYNNYYRIRYKYALYNIFLLKMYGVKSRREVQSTPCLTLTLCYFYIND